MRYDLIVRGRIVTPGGVVDNGWVAIMGEIIAGIGTGTAPEAEAIQDYGDSWVLPGGIDAQTHAGSYWGLPGLEPSSRAAACGGITTMIEMPFDHPIPLNSMERFAEKVAAIARHAYCDVALYATVAPGQTTDEMPRLAEAGVCAFKISVCESHPVRFPRIPADQQHAILKQAAVLGLPVGIHNEDQEIVRAETARMRALADNSLKVHTQARPEAAELAATALFLELGALAGADAHIVHISTPRGFDIVERYRQAGHKATGEICVHYLIFDPEIHGERLGAKIKVNPPLRPGAAAGLWERLRAGEVEFVSSDHSTMSLKNKESGSIFDAGPGMPGIESLMPAFFTGLVDHGFDAPSTLAAHLSEKPAKFFGLWPRKGAIAVGADADLVVLEPGAFTYDSTAAHDDVNWSPYDGMVFKARVASTLIRGRQVWDGRTVRVQPGFGRFLPRLRRAHLGSEAGDKHLENVRR